MTQTQPPVARQPLWFVVLFALAVSGGAVAYVPLLTVLLPLQVAAVTGAEDVAALARITFLGAIMASVANIAFGMLSDRTGNRVGWIVAGLISSSILLVAIGYASDITQIIVLVMAWQVGLNMMLAALLAWAGDCFPDEQKGTLGGFLALAPAVGALAGSLVTSGIGLDPQARLLVVALLVALLVLPSIVFGKSRARAELLRPAGGSGGIRADAPTDPLRSRAAAVRLWAARFLVQICEAGLFAFLLFWLRSIVPDFHENSAANLYSVVLVLAVPVSLLCGRWSDHHARPIAPLIAAAAIAAMGLMVMAVAEAIGLALAGYAIFGLGAAVFLSLHTGQTLRVLPQPQHRGRDLGVFNLTNTLPSLVMPWLTLALVPGFGFAGLFACFAGLVLVACGILLSVAKPAPAS